MKASRQLGALGVSRPCFMPLAMRCTPAYSSILLRPTTRSASSRPQPPVRRANPILEYPESRVNPPLTTLPPPLTTPDRAAASSTVSYYIGLAKAYVTFYKTGMKSVFAARKALSARRAEAGLCSSREIMAQFRQKGTIPQSVSRADWILMRRVRHDTMRIPIFGLILLVCGELTPLIALYIQGVMPYTCRLPKQLAKDVVSVEARRVSSFTRIAPALPNGMVGDQSESARHLAHGHVLRSLHLIPKMLDLVTVGTLVPLYWWLQGRQRLRFLAVDDVLLRRDLNPEQLSPHELKLACVERGITVTGVPIDAQRGLLTQWLTLTQIRGPAEQRAEEGAKRILALLTTRVDKWRSLAPGFALPRDKF